MSATRYPQILDDALEAVGNTPLIRLSKIREQEGLRCNLLAKVEFFSAGGSVKDRIAHRMVDEAERNGILKPGESVIIEPTSGNTGIGLALACAIKGYKLIITLPEKMSREKEATLRALGAEVVRTPTNVPWDSPESLIGVARRLRENIPNSVILDQYSNPNNPLAHELTTGPEIIAAIEATPSTAARPSSGHVDAVVIGAGTGGTISGVSRAIKTVHNPNCVVVGADPKGSMLAVPDTLNDDGRGQPYVIEGIGYDFVPQVLDRDPERVDVWLKTDDQEAFAAAHRLMRTEGLLVGGSSGTVLAAALRYLKSDDGWKNVGGVEGKNVVLVLPDGLRNYISKPWFLETAMKTSDTQLAKDIKQILANP